MTRRLFLLLLAVLALAVGAAACGGDDDDESSDEPAAEDTTTHTDTAMGGGTHLTLTADPDGSLSFDQTELTAAAGEVTIELVNESGIPHNVEIEGQDAVSETITEGTTELTVTLEPGEYTFFCNISGHRAAGMEGTLTVE